MRDLFTKAVKPQDLTELTVEWIIHETGQPVYKKLTLIVNIIAGKSYIKYGVIDNGFCVLITKSQKKALDKYNKIPTPKVLVYP